MKTYQGHVNKQYSLSGAFGTYTGKEEGVEYAFVASGDEEGQVVLWDVSSKNVLQRLEGHGDAVLSVHTHPTEKLIVSAGLDRTIRLWRPREGEVIVNGEKKTEKVNGVGEEGGVNGIEREETNGFDPDVLPPNPLAEG